MEARGQVGAEARDRLQLVAEREAGAHDGEQHAPGGTARVPAGEFWVHVPGTAYPLATGKRGLRAAALCYAVA